MTNKRPSLKMQEQLASRLKVGMPVAVFRDDGTVLETTITDEPWLMGGHSWVVKVAGIAGGYSVARVQPRWEKINP